MPSYSSGTTDDGQTSPLGDVLAGLAEGLAPPGYVSTPCPPLRNPPPAPDQLVKQRKCMERAHRHHPIPENRRGTSPWVPDAVRPGAKPVLADRSSNALMKGRDWVAVHRGVAWSDTDARTNAAYSSRCMDYDLAASRRMNREPAWLSMILQELWGDDGAGFPIKAGFVRMFTRLIEAEREGFIGIEISLSDMGALCEVAPRTIQRWTKLCEARGILEVSAGWQAPPRGYTRSHRIFGKLSYRLGGAFVRRVGLALHEDVRGEFPSGGNFRAATKSAAVALRKEARAHTDAVRDRNWQHSLPHLQRKHRAAPPHSPIGHGGRVDRNSPGDRSPVPGAPGRAIKIKERPTAGAVLASPDRGNCQFKPGTFGPPEPKSQTQTGEKALRVHGVSAAFQEELRKSGSSFAAAFLSAQTRVLLVLFFFLAAAGTSRAETSDRIPELQEHETRRTVGKREGRRTRGNSRDSDARPETATNRNGDWWQCCGRRSAAARPDPRRTYAAIYPGCNPNTGRHFAGAVEPNKRRIRMNETKDESEVGPAVHELQPKALANGSICYHAKVPALSPSTTGKYVMFVAELEGRHCVNLTAVTGWKGRQRIHCQLMGAWVDGDASANIPRYLTGKVGFRVDYPPGVEHVEFSVTIRAAPAAVVGAKELDDDGRRSVRQRQIDTATENGDIEPEREPGNGPGEAWSESDSDAGHEPAT